VISKLTYVKVIVIIIRAPTGKPVGSEYFTKFEPTGLPVGALKKRKNLTLETASTSINIQNSETKQVNH
jgi:hypothetical protein